MFEKFPLLHDMLFYLSIFLLDVGYFLFLEKKKVTKENSRQTRSLRAFCLAVPSPCATCIINRFFSYGISHLLFINRQYE